MHRRGYCGIFVKVGRRQVLTILLGSDRVRLVQWFHCLRGNPRRGALNQLSSAHVLSSSIPTRGVEAARFESLGASWIF
jgi:hypothetical protein